ncbi:glycosyltransferase, partial [Salmonella sp. hn-f5]|nr:glycosyltransferase [Salmonella sp. hn-f5]
IHDPLLRARFAQPDEALLIHVSNFRRVKRPQDVIRVFARVAAKLPARLLMVGDGPERPECFALAQELEVMGRVQFLEFIPEVERVLGL